MICLPTPKYLSRCHVASADVCLRARQEVLFIELKVKTTRATVVCLLPLRKLTSTARLAAPMQQPLNSRIRLADLQGSLRDEEVAAPLATTSRVPSRTRLLAERALSPFFAPESTDTDPRVQPRRLVRRDSAFHQSSGKINMHRGLRAGQLLGLAQKDWYHVWRAARTARLLGLVVA